MFSFLLVATFCALGKHNCIVCIGYAFYVWLTCTGCSNKTNPTRKL